MSEDEDDLIGRECGGCRIEAFIGSGGMGRVFRAKHEVLGKEVALKLLSQKHAADDHYVQRFLREAKLASDFRHPNLVEVFDCGYSDLGYFMTMELVRGVNLVDILETDGKLTEDQVMNVAEQTLCALIYAHERGVVHRDIKPDNLMLQDDGIIKLTDLGLAKASKEEDLGLTQSGMVVGTPYYISPEQIQGSKKVDVRSDLYSLGATLFHLVTGSRPYEGDSSAIVMNKHLHDPTPDPRSRSPEMSEGLRLFIMRLMNKNPEYRYISAREALRSLQVIQEHKSDPQRCIQEVVFLEETSSKDSLWKWVGGSTFVLILLAGGYLYMHFRHPHDGSTQLSTHSNIPMTTKTPMSEGAKPVPPVPPVKAPQLPLPPKEPPAPIIPTLKLGAYRVQNSDVIRDGFFKAGAASIPVELMQSNILKSDPNLKIFIDFDLQTIIDQMSTELGQEPDIRRADLAFIARFQNLGPDSAVRLVRLRKPVQEGFDPDPTPIVIQRLASGPDVRPLKFNISDEIQKFKKGEPYFGWALWIEGSGILEIQSGQSSKKELIPSITMLIGIRPELVPGKKSPGD